MIARNEEKCILECLRSLTNQDYATDNFEIVVVDNASADSTREIVLDFIKTFPTARLVDNPRLGVAANRNAGVLAARYPTIAFLDADCQARPNWLTTLERAFSEETARDARVVGVGGPNVAPDDTTLFRRVVAVATTNYWGHHGSVQAMNPHVRVDVDHLPTLNVMYDRKRLIEIGLFDETQGNISEDVDMSHRLTDQGYRLVFEPGAVVTHRWREDAIGWIKNIEVYGKGRSWLMKKDSSHIKLQFAAPIILLGGAILALGSPLVWWLGVPFAMYCVLTFLVSILACIKPRKLHYVPYVFFVYLITHLSYGVGQIHGLLSARGSDTPKSPAGAKDETNSEATYYEHQEKYSFVKELIAQARKEMFDRFMETARPTAETLVLDVGVTSYRRSDTNSFEKMYPYPNKITALGLDDASFLEEDFPGLTFVRGSALDMPFADKQFDLATSWATIEHVGSYENQRRFVEEVMRVSRRCLITTPNRWYPVELHTVLPLVHWLPPDQFRSVLRLLKINELASEENLNLLGERDFMKLLPPGVKCKTLHHRLFGPISNLLFYLEGYE